MRHAGMHPVRLWAQAFMALWIFITIPLFAVAAPYAGFVMDARTGETLHAENADTRLHPASLTKMMTLYIAFQAIETGEISADTVVTISRNAAAEPPSKLGLRPGQKIKLRYLIRAAAVKSANDAATAIGEAIEGSEAAFVRRMNRTAKSLGMTRTTFKNAHGLTRKGHLSTARDMSVLGRHIFYDFPGYYNLFSRTKTDAGIKSVRNTNRRMLRDYAGADGIKTGYTRAAGFNLVASAERNGERIIATVFGGRSTTTRNNQVAKLLNLGFEKAPRRVAVVKPRKPAPLPGRSLMAEATNAPRPMMRPKITEPQTAPPAPQPQVIAAAPKSEPQQAPIVQSAVISSDDIDQAVELALAVASAVPAPSIPRPELRPAAFTPAPQDSAVAEAVTISTSNARDWGVTIGRFPSRYAAEKALLQTALSELGALEGAVRKVHKRRAGFDAEFYGLTQQGADLACMRLKARKQECSALKPDPQG